MISSASSSIKDSDLSFRSLVTRSLRIVSLPALLILGSAFAFADPNPPGVISFSAPDVTSGGGSSHDITLNWEVDGGGANINASTFGPSDITVTGPVGTLTVQSSVPNPTTNSGAHSVRYRLQAPGGQWDLTDNGVYTISTNAGEVILEGFGPGDPNPIIANTAQTNLATFTVNIAPPGEIANSIADFDPNGTQGVNGWTYGFRDYVADGGGNDYGVNDFIAFSEAGGWTWNGWRWDWAAGDPPYTTVYSNGGHPNGGGNEQWAIWRYQVEITEPTPLAVTWSIYDDNGPCGSGTTGSIHLNGTRVHSHAVAQGDTLGATFTVYVNASPGDFIDLALTPEGPNGERNDSCDGCFISMAVNTKIPANPVQPDGTPFIPAAPFTLSPSFTWTNRFGDSVWPNSFNWNDENDPTIPGSSDVVLLPLSPPWNRLSLSGNRTIEAAWITAPAFRLFSWNGPNDQLTVSAGRLLVEGTGTSWSENPIALGSDGEWHISKSTGRFRVGNGLTAC